MMCLPWDCTARVAPINGNAWLGVERGHEPGQQKCPPPAYPASCPGSPHTQVHPRERGYPCLNGNESETTSRRVDQVASRKGINHQTVGFAIAWCAGRVPRKRCGEKSFLGGFSLAVGTLAPVNLGCRTGARSHDPEQSSE